MCVGSYSLEPRLLSCSLVTVYICHTLRSRLLISRVSAWRNEYLVTAFFDDSICHNSFVLCTSYLYNGFIGCIGICTLTVVLCIPYKGFVQVMVYRVYWNFYSDCSFMYSTRAFLPTGNTQNYSQIQPPEALEYIKPQSE